MWQMGGVRPMFDQVDFFNKFAGKAYEDEGPRNRYATESTRGCRCPAAARGPRLGDGR